MADWKNNLFRVYARHEIRNMPSTPAIRSVIQRALDEKGWKGRKLAQLLDISPSTVYRWLNGQSDPDTQLWPQIEQALGLPETTLLNAKHSSMETEYHDVRAQLFEQAAQRLQENRRFTTFPEFYAKYMDSDISVQIVAQLTGETPATVSRWIAHGEPPPTRHWATIEKHYQLGKGTFKRIAGNQPAKRVMIDPDSIAASGHLKEEDRPAMARLLEQILENQAELRKQQARIIEHLNLNEDEP